MAKLSGTPSAKVQIQPIAVSLLMIAFLSLCFWRRVGRTFGKVQRLATK